MRKMAEYISNAGMSLNCVYAQKGSDGDVSVPGTGSFIRPTASVVHGRSFLQALQSKYVESPQRGSSKETVTLGSSSGAIEVEAVGLDRVRSKLAKLEKLREVSLDGEDMAYADPPGEIGSICPSKYFAFDQTTLYYFLTSSSSDIRGLNLSNNLLSSWIAAAQITAELPKLETLDLRYVNIDNYMYIASCLTPCSRNHLTGLTNTIIANIHTSFRSLQELRLNNTSLPWNEAVVLSSALPQLRSMELGYNEYEQLGEVRKCLHVRFIIASAHTESNISRLGSTQPWMLYFAPKLHPKTLVWKVSISTATHSLTGLTLSIHLHFFQGKDPLQDTRSKKGQITACSALHTSRYFSQITIETDYCRLELPQTCAHHTHQQQYQRNPFPPNRKST